MSKLGDQTIGEGVDSAYFEAQIALQLERRDALFSAHDFCKGEAVKSLTLPQLETKLAVAEEMWQSFRLHHEDIAATCSSLYLSSDYQKEKVFGVTLRVYEDVSSTLNSLIANLKSAQSAPSVSALSSTSKLHGIQLFEKIKIKPFSGRYQDWKEFEDLFQAMIGTNPDLTDVHKMTLLKNAVQGDAARILQNLKTTNDNFAIAWTLLTSRYENKRLLISTQLDKLFGDTSPVESTSKGLHSLLNGIREAQDSLTALGEDTSSWGMPIVYHTVKRLDASIRREWERKLGSNTDYPELKALQEFLKSEATSLESIELTSEKVNKLKLSKSNSSTASGKSTKNATARTYAATAQSSSTAQSQPRSTAQSVQRPAQRGSFAAKPTSSSDQQLKPWMAGYRGAADPGHVCDYCDSKDHFIASCSDFKKLSSIQRMQYAMDSRLCANCLGRHDVQYCRSSKTCFHCGMKHHSLVHPSSSQSKTKPAQTPASGNGNAPTQESAQKQDNASAHYSAQPLPSSISSPAHRSSSAQPDRCSLTISTSATACFGTAQALHSSISSAPAPIISSSDVSARDNRSICSPAQQSTFVALQHQSSLLATALAQLTHPVFAHQPVRMLLDSASELSFITSKLAQQLELPKISSTIALSGIGNTPSGRTKGVSIITLKSLYNNAEIKVPVHRISKLTSILPSFKVDSSSWSHLHGLQLADPHYRTPGQIDVILGAAPFAQIISSEIKRGQTSQPIALNTIFGWVVFGAVKSRSSPAIAPVLHAQQDQALHDLLTKFWTQEEVNPAHSQQLTSDEEFCEEHFMKTHSRDSSGRYIVRLPVIPAHPQLGESRNVAYRCLRSMLKRLSNDSTLNQLYRDFMREYEALGHMRRAPEVQQRSEVRTSLGAGYQLDEMTLAHDTSVSGGLRVSESGSSGQVDVLPPFYLPHHGVLREHSVTTKLRVVFNGSALTSSGFSLNDVLFSGPKLQLDIFDVLLWIRSHKIIFSTDITKMFRQIDVHPADWDLQRILWLDEHENVVPYQLTTVTYGTRPAPYLSVRVLQQLVKDEGSKYPLAIAPMSKGRYVDDIFGGADTLHETQLIAQDLQKLCMTGSFPLAKWSSNQPTLLQALSLDSISSALVQALDDTELKVLGLSWNPTSDNFLFTPKAPVISKITNRSVLSAVAQLFDPLGFLAPVIVRAKMFIQQLWLNKSGWDDELPPALSQRWTHLRDDLPALVHLHIPRWINTTNSSYIEIHGFSDASQLAMAACIFLKVVNSGSSPQVTLLCSKTKVAPLKPVTIPRLELSAAWMLAKLVNHAQSVLELAQAPVYLWTDSSVALTWILDHPSRWKEYVRTRVSAIIELCPTAKWLHVPGKQNPADCASRGISSDQLRKLNLWWEGPDWLKGPFSSWPAQVFKPSAQAHKEERSGVVFHATATPDKTTHGLWHLLSRHSSLYKLLRITALCLRFSSILKRKQSSIAQVPISPAELLDAQIVWVKIIQRVHFSSDIRALQGSCKLPTSHFLPKLNGYLDGDGVLRVGGRLANAELDQDAIHPMILPRKSQFSALVIDQAHRQTLHGGTQLTLMTVREKFWILGGRAPVRSAILKCVVCARYRAQRAQQLMGQLPADRVVPVRPFHTTGVDYAGPFTLKTFQGRGAKTYKCWIAVFVCFVTSAVHLELVSDYSTDAFIKAYRRFVSRRGSSSILYSDCGTNFKGADSFLKALFHQSSEENAQLVSSLTQLGTKWIYSPPGSPHFGGKWEAAVKSVKTHLVRILKTTMLTFEDFSTLLAQIEAVLNSRPLSPLTDDPDDLRALTPAHFLHGGAPGTLPEPALTHLPESRLALWELIQQKLQHFWQRWSKECLQRYLAFSKWRTQAENIKVGSLALLIEENFPPAHWPLARIVEVHPGKDGLIRVVTLKTSKTTLVRPIAKLVVLPVDDYRKDVAVGGENVTKVL